MLYLIESGNFYKIGYAKDIKQRLKAYNTHNPNFNLIDYMEGDIQDEHTLHELCMDYKEKLEWFTKCPEILLIWKTYKKIIPKITELKQEIQKLKNSAVEFNPIISKLEKFKNSPNLITSIGDFIITKTPTEKQIENNLKLLEGFISNTSF